MKITEALEKIKNTKKKITRKGFENFSLCFNTYEGYLMLMNGNTELTPYILSQYDFLYEWEIKD